MGNSNWGPSCVTTLFLIEKQFGQLMMDESMSDNDEICVCPFIIRKLQLPSYSIILFTGIIGLDQVQLIIVS